MISKRSVPWIHRYSRFVMGAIATVGAIITSYLTIMAFGGKTPICPTNQVFGLAGCDVVLNSDYAKFAGLPLSLFGLLAYIAMIGFALSPYLINLENNKKLRNQLEEWTWKFLLIGGVSMAVFSAYLIYISLFVLKAECIYCVSSATCSIALFILSIIGREWEDIGQVFFTAVIVSMITILGTLGFYANVNKSANVNNGNEIVNSAGKIVIPQITTRPEPPIGWEIKTTSGEAEIALAEHLTATKVKMYGAFWCPHCFDQKLLFGKEAFEKINYIECDPSGKNPQPQACVDAGIKGYPTWEFNGKINPGIKPLEELAKLSNYQGKTDFKYALPE